MTGGAVRWFSVWMVALAMLLVSAPESRAIEAFDGRLQIHGFAEMQFRAINNSFSEELDLAQWYNVLNVEIEGDIAPDGWWIFDLIQTYSRIEVRYDCIYTRGCGMFRSADTWGNRANHIPRRLRDGVSRDFGGVIRGQGPNLFRIDTEKPSDIFRYLDKPNPDYLDPTQVGDNCRPPKGSPCTPENAPALFDPKFNPTTILEAPSRLAVFNGLFDNAGSDALVGTADDPARYVLGSVLGWKFYIQETTGPVAGGGNRILGPVLPENKFTNLAQLRNIANPFRGERPPQHTGAFRVDSVIDPRVAALDSSTPFGLRPRTPAEGAPGSFQFGEETVTFIGPIPPNTPSGNSVKFRGFSGDYSGVVPWREPSLVNEDDFFSQQQFPQSILAQQGRFNLTGCKATANATCYDEADPPVTQTGVFNLLPDSNIQVSAGLGELPLRPAPDTSNLAGSNPGLLWAQGLYYPSRGLRHALKTQDFDTHPFNIGQDQRAWNRGDSQDDEKEFKEGYVDLEMLDSKLWFRGGKQNIVWGKTELFRTTDQFNPQDFALGSLVSLEEGRIALWSARFVYSFYDVGPFEDVRVEVAANLDDFQEADLGGCGEPFTLDVVCQLTLGIAAHSFAGLGIAGIDRPPDWWNDFEGLEYGGRIEWRWDRFSFAISDFYGYDDFPYVDQISYFSRNVDLYTGRPLIMELLTEPKGTCNKITGKDATPEGLKYDDASAWQSMQLEGIGSGPDCLKAGGAAGEVNENMFGGAQNALYNHPGNQSLFSLVCASLIGGVTIDPQACSLTVFNSSAKADDNFQFTLMELISTALVGEPAQNAFYAVITKRDRTDLLQPGEWAPLAPLNRDGGASDDTLTPRNTLFCLGDEGDPDAWKSSTTKCNPDALGLWSMNSKGGRGTDGVITARDAAINKFNDTAEAAAATDGDANNNGVEVPCNMTNLGDCRLFSFDNQAEDYLTLDNTLSNEQRALIGCGPFMGIRCDFNDFVSIDGVNYFPAAGGIDLLFSDASFFVQSMNGIEGTEDSQWTPESTALWNQAAIDNGFVGLTADAPRLTNACLLDGPGNVVFNPDGSCVRVKQTWLTTDHTLVQPQAIKVATGEMFGDSATCTYYNEKTGSITTLPGCRGISGFRVTSTVGGGDDRPTGFEVEFEEGYLPSIDGCVIGRDFGANAVDPATGPSDTTPQAGAGDVRLTIADQPVSVVYKGMAVDVDQNSNADGYIGELGRQLAACADQVGTTFTSTSRIQVDDSGSIIVDQLRGARTLWHPLAGCRVEGNLNLNGDATNTKANFGGWDDGESCKVQMRDFTQNFFNDPDSVQLFKSEGAALSFNLQMFLVATSCNGDSVEDIKAEDECFDVVRPYRPDRCSFAAPHYCENVKGFLGGAGVMRNTVRAGGNGSRGRRTWPWHNGGEAMIRYKKRNVLGFSMDFAEDATKSNWGVEFTWISSHPTFNANSFSNTSNVDTMNLTVSVDRPTFINFLNANRTIFFNSQWFFQYIANYTQDMPRNGPFNVLFTFAAFTGYFQDRLLPTFVSVYDFGSRSGGFLPSIAYRFTEAFSVTMGVNVFFGRTQTTNMPIRGLGPEGNRTDPESLKYKVGVDNFLSIFRKRDEIYMRIRWTF